MVANLNSSRQSVSIKEFAELINVSPDTIRRRIADGTIRAVRIGRLIRVPLDQTIGRPLGAR